jgi:Gly-Xaa carboxypeptidase
MEPWLRKAIQSALTNKKAAKGVADYLSNKDMFQRYLMQTSQAIDLISGGVKINALPEKVYAVINHRIAVESRIEDIRSKLQYLITSEILPKFPSMSFNAWGEISGNTSAAAVGTISLGTYFDEPLEPSPVSPIDTDAYRIFTGTIKQVMGDNVIVAPSLMTGNTDTKFYWALSKNIYRFAPVREGGRENAHTVDERIGMKEHIEGVRFYAQLVLNSDGS